MLGYDAEEFLRIEYANGVNINLYVNQKKIFTQFPVSEKLVQFKKIINSKIME